MTVFQEMVVESILTNQIKWSWYHSFQKTMLYLMKSKYAIHFPISKWQNSSVPLLLGHQVVVLWIQKPCELFCLKVKPSIFWEICKDLLFWGGPSRILYDRLMYIAPSNDHSLLTLNLPFKVILRRRFWHCFLYTVWSENYCCTFPKIDENSFKSTNTTLWL